MADSEFLKKRFGKEAEEKPAEQQEPVDMDKVERIVQKMKQKYSQEGYKFEETDERLAELRGIIAGGMEGGLEIQKVENLKEMENSTVRLLGKMYLAMQGFVQPLFNLLLNMKTAKDVGFYLYSANMRYSAKQWIALAIVVAVSVAAGSVLLLTLLSLLRVLPLAPLPFVGIVLGAFLLSIVVMMLVPKSRAEARGGEISRELPFALRHIATQLSAGIGLYRTLQTVAAADYGPLSEEFSRTITEIEEGTDTKIALRHLALRTQSKALRNALMHVIRALKTGGNLSNIMNEIAEDVSFELRLKMRDFSEKMNFMGVIFIFVAIVLPVFTAILGGIRNAPLGQRGESLFSQLPLTIENMALIYLVIMPLVLGFVFMFIKMIQPHV